MFFSISLNIALSEGSQICWWSLDEILSIDITLLLPTLLISVKKVMVYTLIPLVPGPCDPDDLIDGIIFAANYLGSTQLMTDKTPSKNIRMMQAQEALSRIKVKTHTQTHPKFWADAMLQRHRTSTKIMAYWTQQCVTDYKQFNH